MKSFYSLDASEPESRDGSEGRYYSFEGIENICSFYSTSYKANIEPSLYDGVGKYLYRNDEPLHDAIKKEIHSLDLGGLYAIAFNEDTGKTMIRGIKKDLLEKIKK